MSGTTWLGRRTSNAGTRPASPEISRSIAAFPADATNSGDAAPARASSSEATSTARRVAGNRNRRNGALRTPAIQEPSRAPDPGELAALDVQEHAVAARSRAEEPGTRQRNNGVPVRRPGRGHESPGMQRQRP